MLKSKDKGIGVSSNKQCTDMEDYEHNIPSGLMGGACVMDHDDHIALEWDPWNCSMCAVSELDKGDCRGDGPKQDYWSCDQDYWYWHHVQPRFTMANPLNAGSTFMASGPNTAMLSGKRQSTITKANGSTMTIEDSFVAHSGECDDFVNHAFPFNWVGVTRFEKCGLLEDGQGVVGPDDLQSATYLMAVDASHESIGVKRVHAVSKLPERGSDGAAGLDVFSVEDAKILPWKRVVVNTGIAITIPKGTYARVAPRSGLACKSSVDIAAGVIDSDYTGEIKVCMVNQSDEVIQITSGMKIAQLIIERYAHADVVEVDKLKDTARGDSGFGSTGNVSVKETNQPQKDEKLSDLERTIQAMRECKYFNWKCIERGEQTDESWGRAIKVYNEHKFAPNGSKTRFDKFLEECKLSTQAVVPTATSGTHESSGEESVSKVLHTHGDDFGSKARHLYRNMHEAVSKILSKDASSCANLWFNVSDTLAPCTTPLFGGGDRPSNRNEHKLINIVTPFFRDYLESRPNIRANFEFNHLGIFDKEQEDCYFEIPGYFNRNVILFVGGDTERDSYFTSMHFIGDIGCEQVVPPRHWKYAVVLKFELPNSKAARRKHCKRVRRQERALGMLCTPRTQEKCKQVPINRTLVEVCCGPNSYLGELTTQSAGCRVVRITEKEDFTTSAGVQLAIDNINSPQDGVWFSVPCIGGCAYQSQNWLIGESTREKIAGHWKQYVLFKEGMLAVMRRCQEVGAMIFIEWPLSCLYWQDPDIIYLCNEFGLRYTEFHGCQFGLVSINSCTQGVPINKPWRGACSDEYICNNMYRVCDHTHAHAPCAGADTTRTEGYTREMCAHFHLLFKLRAQYILDFDGSDDDAPCFVCVADSEEDMPVPGSRQALLSWPSTEPRRGELYRAWQASGTPAAQTTPQQAPEHFPNLVAHVAKQLKPKGSKTSATSSTLKPHQFSSLEAISVQRTVGGGGILELGNADVQTDFDALMTTDSAGNVITTAEALAAMAPGGSGGGDRGEPELGSSFPATAAAGSGGVAGSDRGVPELGSSFPAAGGITRSGPGTAAAGAQSEQEQASLLNSEDRAALANFTEPTYQELVQADILHANKFGQPKQHVKDYAKVQYDAIHGIAGKSMTSLARIPGDSYGCGTWAGMSFEAVTGTTTVRPGSAYWFDYPTSSAAVPDNYEAMPLAQLLVFMTAWSVPFAAALSSVAPNLDTSFDGQLLQLKRFCAATGFVPHFGPEQIREHVYKAQLADELRYRTANHQVVGLESGPKLTTRHIFYDEDAVVWRKSYSYNHSVVDLVKSKDTPEAKARYFGIECKYGGAAGIFQHALEYATTLLTGSRDVFIRYEMDKGWTGDFLGGDKVGLSNSREAVMNRSICDSSSLDFHAIHGEHYFMILCGMRMLGTVIKPDPTYDSEALSPFMVGQVLAAIEPLLQSLETIVTCIHIVVPMDCRELKHVGAIVDPRQYEKNRAVLIDFLRSSRFVSLVTTADMYDEARAERVREGTLRVQAPGNDTAVADEFSHHMIAGSAFLQLQRGMTHLYQIVPTLPMDFDTIPGDPQPGVRTASGSTCGHPDCWDASLQDHMGRKPRTWRMEPAGGAKQAVRTQTATSPDTIQPVVSPDTNQPVVSPDTNQASAGVSAGAELPTSSFLSPEPQSPQVPSVGQVAADVSRSSRSTNITANRGEPELGSSFPGGGGGAAGSRPSGSTNIAANRGEPELGSSFPGGGGGATGSRLPGSANVAADRGVPELGSSFPGGDGGATGLGETTGGVEANAQVYEDFTVPTPGFEGAVNFAQLDVDVKAEILNSDQVSHADFVNLMINSDTETLAGRRVYVPKSQCQIVYGPKHNSMIDAYLMFNTAVVRPKNDKKPFATMFTDIEGHLYLGYCHAATIRSVMDQFNRHAKVADPTEYYIAEFVEWRVAKGAPWNKFRAQEQGCKVMKLVRNYEASQYPPSDLCCTAQNLSKLLGVTGVRDFYKFYYKVDDPTPHIRVFYQFSIFEAILNGVVDFSKVLDDSAPEEHRAYPARLVCNNGAWLPIRVHNREQEPSSERVSAQSITALKQAA